jgi:hypothetical protein
MKLCVLALLAVSLEPAFGADGTPSVTAVPAFPAGASRETRVLTLPGPPKRAAEPAAVPERPKADLPDAFKADSSLYLQGLIGKWKKSDADGLMGAPARERNALDNKAVTGHIYAYPDPSGRYKELELDFDSDSGLLRTVFAYPKEMTWQDCRKLWGDSVNSTRAKNGRIFYSYLNRKLDVLVDHGGKVISLGLY